MRIEEVPCAGHRIPPDPRWLVTGCRRLLLSRLQERLELDRILEEPLSLV